MIAISLFGLQLALSTFEFLTTVHGVLDSIQPVKLNTLTQTQATSSC